MAKKKPKFKIGDIVAMKDEFHFNPANKVTSIGRIEAIHIYEGVSVASFKQKDGSFKVKAYSGRITYTISGFSITEEEKELVRWKEI